MKMRFKVLLQLLLLFGLNSVAKAQYAYTNSYGTWYYSIDNGTITITDYFGSVGAVTIPSTISNVPVTCIQYNAINAFSTRTLISITIPKSVTSITRYALSGCNNLTAIYVDGLNPVYSDTDGILFNKSKTLLIQYPQAKGGSSYTIPNSVTNIGTDAFAYCSQLSKVTIPGSVTYIGVSAFNNAGLTNVTIPNSVLSISVGAFESCRSLTTATVGSGVTNIGAWAFENCTTLSRVYFNADILALILTARRSQVT